MTISATDALRYVRQGLIGEYPLKRGVPGGVSKDTMKSLAGDFESFVEIKKAIGDTD